MLRLEDRDFFTDPEILVDPYEYFEAVREHGPIYQPAGKDYLIITGFAEALEIFKNSTDFSSSIALQGAAHPLTFVPEGPDISDQLEAHRSDIIGHDLLVNLDDSAHINLRALVNRLFVPSRLKANEEYMDELSEEMIDAIVAKGGGELIQEIATPFVTAVVADLLGVPREDRQFFMDLIQAAPPPGSLNSDDNDYRTEAHPMIIMGGYFARYIQERIDNPREDIMSELAHSTYPDGSRPKLEELVNLSTFMFGAGQDTSAKLIGNAMRYIADEPGLQDKLRADGALIPLFLEEVLRLEGSSKITARLTRRDTVVGGISIPAGTKIAIALAAISRDPRRWDDPHTFILNRPRIKEHLSFGRGAHTCAGAPLARAEVRILFEKLFAKTSHMELDEERHGTPGNRIYSFEPSFIVRGLADLKVKLTPSRSFADA
ncbi:MULTISPECIES: cytochrome P450 [unclassified Novosphingobium]|uniref:cytochrome P450 n=1 Tax=unclassified Novosphingobium TaxID=2644732 RepID=UPI00135A975B|nr:MULTISPECIES: cytochrome P450 [unclassified Novosphingobium]